MAEFNLPFGVRIANNDPVDYDRYVAADITARDAVVTAGRAYEGIQIYVEADQSLYILTDLAPVTWEIVGNDASALADMKEYVDGSLGTRDTSINNNTEAISVLDASIVILRNSDVQLDASIVILRNSDVQLDASVVILRSDVAQLDASIVTLDSSVIWLFDNQYDASGSYLPLTGGTLTGDLVVNTNVAVGGSLTIDGSLYVVGVEAIDVSSAYIQLNTGLAGPPPITLQSGIIVQRGSESPYAILYDEDVQTFRIGITELETSTHYSDASTQAVATREDAPVSQGIAYWNSSENRLDTSTGFTLDILTGSTGYIPSYGSPLSQSTLSFLNGVLENIADEDFTITSHYKGSGDSRHLILKAADASTAAGDVILRAGNSDLSNNRGNIVLVPGDQHPSSSGTGLIELSDTNSLNQIITFIAKSNVSVPNVGIQFSPKGIGNINLFGRTVIGNSTQFDFTYTGGYNQFEIKNDQDGLIRLKSEGDVSICKTLTIAGGVGVDASFAGNLIIKGGDAANTGVGGGLVLSAGAGAGGDVDGSIYMLNIAEASTNKILYRGTNGDITYANAPPSGTDFDVSLGTDNQIPFMTGSSNFAYSSEFTWNGSVLRATNSSGGTAIGLNASATNGLALGANATQSNGDSMAVGDGASATGNRSSAVGPSSTAPGGNSLALGDGADALSNKSIAIGQNSQVSAEGAILIGSIASGNNINNLANSFKLMWDGSTGFQTGMTMGTQVMVSDNPETNLTSTADGAIVYDSSFNKFMGRTSGAWAELGGGGGSASLEGLTDVSILDASIHESLTWNPDTSVWENVKKAWYVDSSLVQLVNDQYDVQLGSIQIEPDAGVVTLVDMGISATPPVNTEESYTFDIAGNTIAKVWSLADGVGDASVTGFVVDADALYFNDPQTNDSWRMRVTLGDASLVFEKRLAGVWTYQGEPGSASGGSTLAELTDVSIGGLGASQDGSTLVYNHAETSWTYGVQGGKVPLVDYLTGQASTTLDLGKDSRAKLGVGGNDVSIFIDESTLSAEYSHTMVLDITGNSGTNTLIWDPSLSSNNWVDGDVLGAVNNTSTWTVTINTNGSSYGDILINYIKKGA